MDMAANLWRLVSSLGWFLKGGNMIVATSVVFVVCTALEVPSLCACLSW